MFAHQVFFTYTKNNYIREERKILGQEILIGTSTTGFLRFSISNYGDYLLVLYRKLLLFTFDEF